MSKNQNSKNQNQSINQSLPVQSISIPVSIQKNENNLQGVSFHYNDDIVTITAKRDKNNIFFTDFNVISESFNLINDSEKYKILVNLDQSAFTPVESELIREYRKTLKIMHSIRYSKNKIDLIMNLNQSAYEYIVKRFNRLKSDKKELSRTALSIVKSIGNGLLKQDIMNVYSDSDNAMFDTMVDNGSFNVTAKNEQYIITQYCNLINEFFSTGKIESSGKKWFIRGVQYKLQKVHITDSTAKFITYTDIKSFRKEISKRFECSQNKFEDYIDFSQIQIAVGKEIETINIK